MTIISIDNVYLFLIGYASFCNINQLAAYARIYWTQLSVKKMKSIAKRT